jgi:hypothetical protein
MSTSVLSFIYLIYSIFVYFCNYSNFMLCKGEVKFLKMTMLLVYENHHEID